MENTVVSATDNSSVVTPDSSNDLKSHYSGNSGNNNNILWTGVCRDDVLLAEVSTDSSDKIPKAGRRLMCKEKKTGWDFYTYKITTRGQERSVKAIRFHIFERLPLPNGSRAKLHRLQHQTFLNGSTVRILEFDEKTNKYLIRPTVPLPEEKKLSTTGKLLVHASNLQAIATDSEQNQDSHFRVWTLGCLYDAENISQKYTCLYMEKIAMILESLRGTEEWQTGGQLSCQDYFAPVLQSQMEQFEDLEAAIECLDKSMEFTRKIVERNMEIIAETVFMV